LALDIIRDPQGTSVLELASVWWFQHCCCVMRPPAVFATAFNAGMTEVALSELRKSSPAEWCVSKAVIL
jgi:hypothetical protein